MEVKDRIGEGWVGLKEARIKLGDEQDIQDKQD